ncbi:MAG: thioesterase family protein [bacterium]
MKTYSTHLVVEAEHLDEGEHAGFLAQQAMAKNAHSAMREQLGLGLMEMKERHSLFLVMRTVGINYHSQLCLGEELDIEITMWISRPTCLAFYCTLRRDGKVTTKMGWEMALVNNSTKRPCTIPDWMREKVGTETPTKALQLTRFD